MHTWLQFIHTDEFERSRDGVLDEEGLRELQNALVERPAAGDIIQGTGGARKIRVAAKGRGKRGGARVIYYYATSAGRLFLLLAYPKSDADSLSDAGKKALKTLIAELE